MTGPQVCWKRTTSSRRPRQPGRAALLRGPLRQGPLGAGHEVAAQDQLGDQVQGVPAVLGQLLTGPVGGLGHDRDGLGVGCLPGHHVRAVAVHRHEELDHRVVQRPAGVVAQVDVVGADVDEQVDEAVDLGVLPALHDLALGCVDELVEVAHRRARAGPDLVVQQRERRLRRGVGQDAGDAAQRVVAGRAVAGPVRRQLLLALEDLLHDDVGTPAVGPSGLRQASQVAARVREAVGVVDPEAVEHAVGEQVEQHPVGRLEDDRVLDADRGQGVDVEEPAVVELLVRHAPVREPVPLLVDELGHRQVLGAGADREHVVEVPEHRLGDDGPALPDRHVLGAQLELPGVEDLADARAEHRHEDRTLRHGPVHVQPARVAGPGPVAQHRPHARLCHSGVGTSMWLGTTSAITPMPRACSASASARRPSSPPSSGLILEWSTTS
jgi:hypothetical protein